MRHKNWILVRCLEEFLRTQAFGAGLCDCTLTMLEGRLIKSDCSTTFLSCVRSPAFPTSLFYFAIFDFLGQYSDTSSPDLN
jgi:hypothetical protein